LTDAIPHLQVHPDTIPDLPDEVRYWINTTHEQPQGKPHPNLVRLMSGIRSLTPSEREERPDDKIVTEHYPLLSYGRRMSSYHGEIVDPDAASKTIICTYQSCPRLFVGIQQGSKRWVRTFTLTELAQLQGFPANYPFKGTPSKIIQQIGNAVPPPLITAVVHSIQTIEFTEERPRMVIDEESEEDEI